MAALVGAAALLFASVGGVSGAGSVHQSDTGSYVACDDVDTPLGQAYVGVFVSEEFGTDAYLDVWSDDPEAPPVLTRDQDRPVQATFTSTSVTASIPLLPSGTATLTGTRVATEPFAFDDVFNDGNHKYRESASGQLYAFSGTLSLPGVAGAIGLPAERCGSDDHASSVFFNQPHSNVARFSGTSNFCETTNAAGDRLGMFLDVTDGDVFVDANVNDASGAGLYLFGTGTLAADGTATIALEELDLETGVPTGGTGSLSISVTSTGVQGTFVVTYTNEVYRVRQSLLDLEGTLASSLGSFSVGDCPLAETRTKRISTPSNGPKPGGKAPANDLPASAIAITAGYKATLATKGARQANEGRFECLEFPDEEGGTFVIPVEHTVWYRFTGTGRAITIDTAGSDFDTAIAVYAGSPGALPAVACVDDMELQPIGFTTQAALTFTGTAGTSYWVQIGGLREINDFTETVSLPYGTLKVAVR